MQTVCDLFAQECEFTSKQILHFMTRRKVFDIYILNYCILFAKQQGKDLMIVDLEEAKAWAERKVQK